MRSVVFTLFAVVFCVACQGCVHFRLGGSAAGELFNTKWTYNESDAAKKIGLLPPSEWKKSFGTCNTEGDNSHQSPINIKHLDVPQSNAGVLPLTFSAPACDITVRNIGSTLSAMPTNPAACKAQFTTLSNTVYKFYEMHLHWHQYYNHRGTEHKVDGQAEAVEAHIVHYNAKFKNIQEAFDDANVGNIAVVAVRYTVAPTPENATEALALDTFFAKTYPTLRYMDLNTSMAVDPVNPYDLIGSAIPRTNIPMYHYNGSLTTPLCDSIVSWYIVQQTVMMSQSQIRQLRFFLHVNQTEDEKHKLGFNNDANVRPVAPLNHRDVVGWPYIVEPNFSSDSAPDDDGSSGGLSGWKLGLVVGGSILGGVVITLIIVVIVVKKGPRKNYDSINSSA